jgi:hypothetical protein
MRMAEAANQVGIPGGAVVFLKGENLKPGILWNREASRFGSIYDVPAGLTGESLAKVAGQLAAKEKWCLVSEVMQADAAKLAAGWPDADNQPTHIFSRTTRGGYVIALGRFASDADHEGLRETFAELVKAAAGKSAE